METVLIMLAILLSIIGSIGLKLVVGEIMTSVVAYKLITYWVN